MPERRIVKLYTSPTIIPKQVFSPGTYNFYLDINEGSRLILTLETFVVGAGASANIKILNAHSLQSNFCELKTLSSNQVGFTKGILTDFHNFINIELEVLVDDIELMFGLTSVDNALDFSLANLIVKADLDHTTTPNPAYDSVRVGNGVNEWEINAAKEGVVNARQLIHDLLNLNANLQVGNVDNALGNPAFIAPGLGAFFDVRQAIHDLLNLNANIQVGNLDATLGNPVPVTPGTGAFWEVRQAVHDLLNLNANVQVNNLDNSATNPVFTTPSTGSFTEIRQAVHDLLNLNANLQIGNVDVGLANRVPIPDLVHTKDSVAVGNGVGDIVGVNANKEFYIRDTHDNGGLDIIIPLTTAPVEGKVGVSPKTLRKYVIMQALSTNVVWGFSNVTQSFDLFKDQLIMVPVGENTQIWFKMKSATGSVAFGELS